MKILKGLSGGQVLQRLGSTGADVKIEGECSQSGPVVVTLFSKKGSIKNWKNRKVSSASKGRFFASLKGIPAGGPYRLELSCGKETVRVPEFYVGDVWVLAGQSNMQGCGNTATAPDPHPMVHAFSMRREWGKAIEPICILLESPDFCHHGGRQFSIKEVKALKKSLPKGVGPGLPFGEEIWKRSGVPQGLICTAHGGTSMTQWTPLKTIDGNVSLYGSLLASVEATGQPVAGVLWYQGESDASPEAASLYTARMQKLVRTLRKDLKQSSLPWIVVQISRVVREENPVADGAWNRIQEQQRLLPRSIKNLGVVAAVDLSLDDFIHISSEGHRQLGLRLAREADRLALGNRKETATPQLRSMKFPKSSNRVPELPNQVIEVTFDHVVGGLQSKGEPSGFVLLDEEGRDLRAIFKITLHGNVARLHLRTSMVQARVSYGHGVMPVCNITDGRDYALPVFGPQFFLGKAKAFLPYIREWNVAAPFVTPVPLDKIEAPEFKKHSHEARRYDGNDYGLEGFINEHPRWIGCDGQGYFEALMDLPEPMKVDVLMGYDGPFRLWIDRKPFFSDMKGANPCFADKSSKGVLLTAGKHSIQVAMDLKGGISWGFFVRFVRKDVGAGQIAAGNYTKPVYSV